MGVGLLDRGPRNTVLSAGSILLHRFRARGVGDVPEGLGALVGLVAAGPILCPEARVLEKSVAGKGDTKQASKMRNTPKKVNCNHFDNYSQNPVSFKKFTIF